MTNNLQKNIILFLLAALFISGCAGAPVRESLPTYSLNGTTYLSLVGLCDSRKIDFEYDTFTRTARLSKAGHRVSVMAGDSLVLVDGNPLHLRNPVDIYQGVLVVPYKFKEQVVDVLFKETALPSRRSIAAPRIRKIVIDAGHGGVDPGAIGKAGLREKNVTLDIAKRLYNLLRSAGYNVVMTRSADVFVPLARRVDMTNDSGADLFISIHANANRVRSLSGFEVYYISGGANDYRRALSAAEKETLNLGRDCISRPSLNLRTILWDMIYSDNRAQSLELAGDICHSIDRNLNIRVIGVKAANFYVLKGASMPSLLVEIGFLSNPSEERMIKNGSYRQQVASAIAEAVEDYAKDNNFTEACN
ncbi:MAG: N-acetylmuramoyl-L-alanine amidase [Candidatus Omnitrophica bacterium]|nr:N-acetylmuramoyl-L-alanine amidase [Candidatus Omnitrophota bacterium]